MTPQDIDRQIAKLEKALGTGGADEHSALRPHVLRIIRTLNAQDIAIPPRLIRIEEQLDDEVSGDIFENMPV